MNRNEGGWINTCQAREALWVHSGDPKHPHPKLRSGMHSNGYFNSGMIISDELLMRAATRDLFRKFSRFGGDATKVDAVVGPKIGAMLLAEWMRQKLRPMRSPCFWASPHSIKQGRRTLLTFSEKERRMLQDQSVVLYEDAVTTGEYIACAAAAVVALRGTVLPFVLTLVNRSGLSEVEGKKIFSLIEMPMPLWKPADCPLCREGSVAVRLEG